MKLTNTLTGSTLSCGDEMADALLSAGGWEKVGGRRTSSKAKSDDTAKAGDDGSDTGTAANRG